MSIIIIISLSNFVLLVNVDRSTSHFILLLPHHPPLASSIVMWSITTSGLVDWCVLLLNHLYPLLASIFLFLTTILYDVVQAILYRRQNMVLIAQNMSYLTKKQINITWYQNKHVCWTSCSSVMCIFWVKIFDQWLTDRSSSSSSYELRVFVVV
jgi:hypothetical protein